MDGQPSAPVGNRAWIELLHAEVCWRLDQAGIDALVIKGPSIAQWLYPDEARESADVDLLVGPEQWDDALGLLRRLGFEDVLEEFKAWEPPAHSVTLSRSDPDMGRHSIDLHRFFPGIDAPPSAAFEVLWARRVRGRQAGTSVWFPDLPARALIIALHAARDPHSTKTAEDLRRAFAAVDDEQRLGLAELAERLQARPALRAGLATTPETLAAVAGLGLADVAVPAYWALRSQGTSGTAIHLEELTELPWRRRPAATWHWLFPSPALMRIRDPRASRSRAGLAAAYASRLGDGLRGLPRAVRDLRAARRG